MYLDARRHGALTGKILQLIPNRLIGQSGRSTLFTKRVLNSTLDIFFGQHPSCGRIELTDVSGANIDFAGVSEGSSK